MNKLDQYILCIQEDLLFKKGKWNGLQQNDKEEYYKLLVEHSEFHRRGDLEMDSSYKQIIPQIALRYKNAYFLHKQVSATEKRLNGMCPVFVGGHVEEFDRDGDEDLLQTALMRELYEEVTLNTRIVGREFVGLLYIDDDNPVNHVHVGLLYIFDIDTDDVHVREDELEDVGFVTLEYLRKNKNTLTFWSRVFVEYLVSSI